MVDKGRQSSASSTSPTPIPVLAISPGVAIGPAFLYRKTITTIVEKTIEVGQEEAEKQRLHEALESAVRELEDLAEHVAKTVGSSEAEIFEAQQLVLQDPDMLEQVEALIDTQHQSAASALHQVAEEQAKELESLENELIAARGSDIKDAVAKAVHYLTGEGNKHLAPDHPVIIVADDLTPSDTANLDPQNVLGICTVVGGPTTHAAIIARTLEIPAISGFDASILDILRDGEVVGMDGGEGLLYLNIADDLRTQLQASMQQQQQERTRRRAQEEASWRTRTAATADGIAVQVFANVGDEESTRAAGKAGAEGIGLLRTEFLFGGRPIFPDEQEQYTRYKAIFQIFAESESLGKTIIARTLDAGADKPFPALEPLIGPLNEANPALGLRGARIHLVSEELLRQQLRALLRAASETAITLAIMFPMIATLEEVRRLRKVYNDVQQELIAQQVAVKVDTQIGIMVETPAAALMADVLAQEVDFFSIGANDLYQYTMAVDRTNSRVAGMFGKVEPAVWRLIQRVVQAGLAFGKTVAVCGELAADTRMGPLLVGLGVQELSMSPPAIVRVKAALNRYPLEYWRRVAHELLEAETAADMQSKLQEID